MTNDDCDSNTSAPPLFRFRANDLHGQLANDDVPGHARDARSQRVGDHRPVHKRSLHARFQQVRGRNNTGGITR